MTRLYVFIAIAVALGVAFGAAYVVGRADGSNKSLRKSLEDTLTQYRIWDNAASEINRDNDYALCLRSGGTVQDCSDEFLRDQATPAAE